MKAVKKKLWTGWIRIQKILTEKDGISTVELILVLVVIKLFLKNDNQTDNDDQYKDQFYR